VSTDVGFTGWPPPREKHDLMSVRSLCTYNNNFIAGFADIEKPLTQEEKWTSHWSSEVEAPLLSLMQSLFAAPAKIFKWLGKKFVLDTDASNVEIGGVLSQVEDGLEQAVACKGKTIYWVQRKYYMTRQ
jgi:hypothetical protein